MNLQNDKYGLVLFDNEIKFYIGGDTKKEIRRKLLDWYGEVCPDDEFTYTFNENDLTEYIEDFKPKIHRMGLNKLIKYICEMMFMEFEASYRTLINIA